MAGMDISFLSKLMQLNPEGIQNMSNLAAMKAPPPQIGPSSPGMLAPGAFAGVMDPTVGQVPQGAGTAMQGGMQPAPVMPQAAAPQMNPGLNAQQANMLGAQMQQPHVQFPGTAYYPRPGAVQMQGVQVPGDQMQHANLAQLLGR